MYDTNVIYITYSEKNYAISTTNRKQLHYRFIGLRLTLLI
jgi:hypothetical protein